MIDYQGEKIKNYLDKHGIKTSDLAKMLNVDRQAVYQYYKSKNLQVDTVKKILSVLEVKEEVVFGDSNNSNATEIGNLGQDDNGETKFSEISPGRYKMRIPLVPEYAHAGYLSGYSDPEYMETLPVHEPIVNKYHRGNYMAFEVVGDSMDDDSKRSIPHGSIVTCREIKRELWSSRFHTHRYSFYIIIHKYEGIVLKEIIKHDVSNGTLTLHSLNTDKETYPDFTVHLDDVKQIFNVVKKEETY